MSSRFTKKTSLRVKALPQLFKNKKFEKKKRKVRKLIKEVKIIINSLVRRVYGTEQALVAKEYGREFVTELHKLEE